MDKFQVENLPDIDQQQIKRGYCPWCLTKIIPVDDHDECPGCGDQFFGKLTIDD